MDGSFRKLLPNAGKTLLMCNESPTKRAPPDLLET